MASRSQSQAVDLEVEDSGTSQSIGEKFRSLNSTFLSRHFAEGEEISVSIIEKMERNINLLKKEKETMEEKTQIEKQERLKAENELREYKSENMQLKKAQEGLDGLVRSSGEDKRVIRELREEICELKCAKLKAEKEVDAHRSKFEELKMRVILLENDLMLLMSEEPVKITRVSGEVLRNQVVVEENMGAPAGVSDEGSGKEFGGENKKGREGVFNAKAEMVVIDYHENMVLGANEGSRHNLVENEDGKNGASGQLTLQSPEIVVIVNSDDESSSNATLSRKKMTKQGYQHGADLGQEFVSNETRLLKRKQTSCSESTNDEHRANKRQVIQGPDGVPVNSDAEDSSSSSDLEFRDLTIEFLKWGI